MGNMQIGGTGLGYIKRKKRFNDEKQQNHREYLEVIRKAENESLDTKAVQQSVQGHWSNWQGYIKRDMSWHTLLKSTPQLVLFCFWATYSTSVSTQNPASWGFEYDIECALCGKEKASFAHILAVCQKALQSGRYTFHHNVVSKVIAHEIQVMINQVKKEVRKVFKDSITIFGKEGEQHKTSSRKYNKLGILHEAKDWVMKVDVEQQLRFPEAICILAQRPDIAGWPLPGNT